MSRFSYKQTGVSQMCWNNNLKLFSGTPSLINLSNCRQRFKTIKFVYKFPNWIILKINVIFFYCPNFVNSVLFHAFNIFNYLDISVSTNNFTLSLSLSLSYILYTYLQLTLTRITFNQVQNRITRKWFYEQGGKKHNLNMHILN